MWNWNRQKPDTFCISLLALRRFIPSTIICSWSFETVSYKIKSNNLDFEYNYRKAELEQEFQDKEFDIEYKYKNKIKSLEKENNRLLKIIDKFYETVEKFIHWICHKFGIGESKELINNFQEETHTFIDPVKQIENEEREKEWDLEI